MQSLRHYSSSQLMFRLVETIQASSYQDTLRQLAFHLVETVQSRTQYNTSHCCVTVFETMQESSHYDTSDQLMFHDLAETMQEFSHGLCQPDTFRSLITRSVNQHTNKIANLITRHGVLRWPWSYALCKEKISDTHLKEQLPILTQRSRFLSPLCIRRQLINLFISYLGTN